MIMIIESVAILEGIVLTMKLKGKSIDVSMNVIL